MTQPNKLRLVSTREHPAVTAQTEATTAAVPFAQLDALTGLPSRPAFSLLLSDALAQSRTDGKELAVVLLDLDGFKEINQTFGRRAGDDLLQAVSARLCRCLRTKDIIGRDDERLSVHGSVARLSGDEFVLVLNNVKETDRVGWITRRLLEALAVPFQIHQRKIFLTASAGISLTGQAGDDAESLIQRAETAMYHAKKHGPHSYVFFDDYMDKAAAHKLAVVNGLRRALTLGEFVLHYQPILNGNTEEMVGVEALLRWQHPEDGTLLPVDFIQIAEETNLMVHMGEWVLREACTQGRVWMDEGLPPLRMAVNVSRCQLDDEQFVTKVRTILQESGFDPYLLELELSERGVLKNDARTLRQLNELKAMGIRLAIDDFGTGQTSLAYLRKFPLDSVKIDRSYIDSLHDNDDAKAITTAIIALSHSLQLKVVAEGVERPEQAAFLKELACDEMQGFLYAEPLSTVKLAETVTKDRLHDPAVN